MLGKIGALPEELGEVETLLADTGYFRTANVEACEKAGIEPLIAIGRQPHHPPLQERFETSPPAPENPTPVEAMAHRLKMPEGRTLYALHKQTPEPVFGIIKSVGAGHGRRSSNYSPRSSIYGIPPGLQKPPRRGWSG